MTTLNRGHCNGMHYTGAHWIGCTRDRGHNGHHGDGTRTWSGMFHFDGNVCQICGRFSDDEDGEQGEIIMFPGRIVSWIHASCDRDYRDELAYEESKVR
jgi:hypothetical protein